MSWLGIHATELTVVGSILMNISTFIIIVFNLNQLRLNNRSLNVDINFKVFELRKKIYKDIATFIKNVSTDNGLKDYYVETEDNEFEYVPELEQLKESIDNCKYLFSTELAFELELFLLNIEKAILTEQKIITLKNKDSTLWSKVDQQEISSLGDQKKELISNLVSFKTDNFLPYLQVSNFHKNLMKDACSKHGLYIQTLANKIKNFVIFAYNKLKPIPVLKTKEL